MNSSTEVCHLLLEESTVSEMIVKTIWNERSFSVILFDGMKTWTGKFEEDSTVLLSKQLGLTSDEYLRECRCALTTDGGYENFTYKFNNGSFQWKKHDLDMKITFGQISMENTPVVNTLYSIINDLIGSNVCLKKKLIDYKDEKNNLEIDNREMMKSLEECNMLKNQMENDLYSQFLTILNTKKKRIIQLEERLKSKRLKIEVSDDESKSKEEVEDKNRFYECDTDVDSSGSDDDDDDKNKEENDSDAEECYSKIIPKRIPRTERKETKEDDCVEKEKSVEKASTSKENTSTADKTPEKAVTLPKRSKRTTTAIPQYNSPTEPKVAKTELKNASAESATKPQTDNESTKMECFVGEVDEFKNSKQREKISVDAFLDGLLG